MSQSGFVKLHNAAVVLQIIAFDELKTDYKNPIDQCNTLNPVSLCVCAHKREHAVLHSLTGH